MALLKKAFWLLSIFGAVVGIYIMIQAFRKAPTERELAECAMMAAACALTPYCLARSISEIGKVS
jgi:hypothetical protein